MSDIVDIYTDAIHDNLRPLFANWDIGAPRQLGDYGQLHGSLFISLGNVTADFGIQFKTTHEPRHDTRSFATTGSTDVKITAQGKAPAGGVPINARLEVDFADEDAMFFNAAGCDYSMVASKTALGQQIMGLYNADKWDKSWVVVTDLVDSGAVTAAISSGKSASVTFEADASVPTINLADAQLKLSVQSTRNSSFQLAAPQGKNLLLGFCGIQGFFSPGFDPVKRLLAKKGIALPSAKAAGAADLFFGQLA